MQIHKHKRLSPQTAKLRSEAEKLFNLLNPEVLMPVKEENARALVHELQVHQIELEMQNEELRQVRSEVESLLVKYMDLYDLAPVGYITINRKGIILDVNLTGADFMGLDRSHLRGRQFGMFIGPGEGQIFTDYLGSLITSRCKETCEVRIMKQGVVHLIVEIEGIAAASGEEIFIVLKDVTERNRAEEKIINLNGELERLVRERTGELERMNSELEQFCYNISHEFRAPIARLEGFCTMLLEIAGKAGESTMLHCAQRIIAASERLRKVVGALLHLNRLSRTEINLQKLNLSEIAQEIVSELTLQNGYAHATVTIFPDVTATADRAFMEICLKNLLDNALKYSSRNPAPAVEFGEADMAGEHVYFVRDNGIGFDREYARDIFLPFCRLHNGDEFEGIGVGLAIVHRLIEKHKGRIFFETQPGEGATFYFTLEAGVKGKSDEKTEEHT